MHYAIIAAGDGSRLVSEGISLPKPLVRINGVPMIERLIRIFAQNNPESISVIVNEGMTEVQDFLRSLVTDKMLLDLGIGEYNLVIKSTPSSMHSFYELSNVIDAEQLCLTTVDTIFTPQDFAKFISKVGQKSDGLFAVTPYIDDEKPLYVEVDAKSQKEKKGKILGFHDSGNYDFVSGGIYVLNTDKAFPVLDKCIAEGQHRMRNFQRSLLSAGLNIEAYVFDKIMDVDHASDIDKANAFLEMQSKKILMIARDKKFSPKNVEKDARILEMVSQKIREAKRNLNVDLYSEDLISKEVLRRYSVIAGMARKSNTIKAVCDYLAMSEKPVLSYNYIGIGKLYESRYSCFKRLQSKGVKVPLLPKITTPVWIKRFRKDEVSKEDVSFCNANEEVVLMQHVHGDLIKVYAVVDSKNRVKFLKWFYPQETKYTKFGQEKHNDALQYFHFDEVSLMSIAKKIKATTDLQFFGFDAIIDKEGECWVIDINDWPSYSKFQDEAADAIASTILADIEAL